MNRMLVLFAMIALFSGTALRVCAVEGAGAGYENDSVEFRMDVDGTGALLRYCFDSAVGNGGEQHDGRTSCSASREGTRHRGMRPEGVFAEAPPGMRSHAEGMMGPYGDSWGRDRSGIKAKLLIMYRLVDHLNLNEDTATRFFPVYLTYVSKRDSLLKKRGELIRFIAEKADDESVSIKELENKVDELKKNERTLEEEHAAFLKKAEKILDERQYIKLVVFHDKLKSDLISQFRMERLQRMKKMKEPGNDRLRMYAPEKSPEGKKRRND